MKNRVDAHKLGLVVGLFLAVVHLIWALMVAVDVAQRFMDWIFSLHMLTTSFTVGEFSGAIALWLVVVTFVVGYIAGYILALVHNSVHQGNRRG